MRSGAGIRIPSASSKAWVYGCNWISSCIRKPCCPRRQLDAIPTKARLSQVELELAEATLKQVTTLDIIERELQDQLELLGDFRKPANLQLAIQVVSNHKIRAETVKAVHQLMGEPCSTAPEKYVAEIELALKQKYSAGGIRIAS